MLRFLKKCFEFSQYRFQNQMLHKKILCCNKMTYCLHTFADTKTLEKFPPDSAEQQALITAVQNDDGYNWGYASDILLGSNIRFMCFALSLTSVSLPL